VADTCGGAVGQNLVLAVCVGSLEEKLERLFFAFCIFFLFAFVSLDFLCKSVSFMWVLILYVEKEKLNQEKKVLLKFSYIISFVIIDF
jgi:hypothetical protein